MKVLNHPDSVWECVGHCLPAPHLLPPACSQEVERAWRRVSRRASLQRGLQALWQSHPTRLGEWLRMAPLRLLQMAYLLGSIDPDHGRRAIERASQHPFFNDSEMVGGQPSEGMADYFLRTWSPLAPPSTVKDACGRELSPRQRDELIDSVGKWLPRVQIELIRHYCGRLNRS